VEWISAPDEMGGGAGRDRTLGLVPGVLGPLVRSR
jgi:hypothetical protein